jgi:DNA-binding protein HU-beta
MNKAQLIDAIAEKAGLTKADSKKALEAFVATVGETLKSGDKVSLIGFGSFAVAERGERSGRNPQTGTTITIPAKKVIKFKAGNELTAQI